MKKPPNLVIHEVEALERYLDNYFRKTGVTFQQWVNRFGEEPYLSRNQTILRLLAPLQPKRIFEFACAGGFLAKLLIEGLPSVEHYTCSNFSNRMVGYCAKQLACFPNCDVKLINANRMGDTDEVKLESYDTFLTTSFEHIQYDQELIRRLPANRYFVFCLAGFDDPEHFRFFSEPNEIRRRYHRSVLIQHIETLGDKNKKFVTLSRTLKAE